MIHVLNHDSEIIDFINKTDNAIIHAEYKREKETNSELLDLTILSKRAKHFKENNRLIIQDKQNAYREFIIQHIEDSGSYIDVEATASYVVDIGTAKPIPAGKYEKMSVTQKLDEVLRDTGWITGDCDYGGVRTNSWDSVRTPYEMIAQLETSHQLESSFEVKIEGNEVVERRVNMIEPSHLFNGKEIEYGKDLLEMKRTVDFSEIVTALLAFGPENDKGERLTTVVKDDEAQEQFGLPTRYIWGIYEPESDDSNMTLERLTTLATTELNKRKSATVSYEINVADIEKQFPHEIIRFGDIVRIKNEDFVPSLYAESEVIGFTHDLITDDITYIFGNVIEYKENDILKYLRNNIDKLNKKLIDNISNINTIVGDVTDQLEYYERKIFKGSTVPENPVNDMLWYDTSNPNVAVLRRYWNGEWLNETVDDVEKIGGVTREKVLYDSIKNAFENLAIQHSKLMDETYSVLNSEYLVDTDLKGKLQTELNNVDNIFQSIQIGLNAMTSDTATIGALIDIQAQFGTYRQKLQDLYKAIQNAKISADKRLQLLQSQYTDQKFNDALNKVASKFGLTVDSNNNMVGTPDVIEKAIRSSREDTAEQLKSYVKSVDYQTDRSGIVERLDSADSERIQLSNQISDKVSLSEYRNLKIGGRNYLANDNLEFGTFVSSTGVPAGSSTTRVRSINFIPVTPLDSYIMKINNPLANKTIQVSIYQYDTSNTLIKSSGFSSLLDTRNYNFDTGVEKIKVLFRYSDNSDMTLDDIRNAKIKFEKGTIPTDYDIAPEETETKLTSLNTSINQNGKDIQQRATKEEFNANKKTLSKVISDFTNNVATGMTFTYDDNGAIQTMNMGPEGIKLDARKININDGDVLIQNGQTFIKDAYIDKLFSSAATINYLNSVDITAKRLQASDKGTTVNIENGSVTIKRDDGYRMEIGIDGVTMYNPGGSSRFRMDRLYVESAALGTSNSNLYLAADINHEVRAVDVSQIPSDGIASSYRYVPVRADYFIGNQLIINSGTNLYLGTNDEVRVTSRGGYDGSNTIYRNVRAYGYYGDFIESTSTTKSPNFYVRADTEVRLTKTGSTTSHTDVRGNFANFDGIRNNSSNSNLYFGTDGEVRIMGKSFKNSNVYRDIRFGNWTSMSSEKFKHDIQPWNYSVLDAFRNDLQLYSYKLDSEKETDYLRNHHGIIIEREIPIEWRHKDGFDGNEILFWNSKAIQELIRKIDLLEEQINGK
ncbi:hypothetical protein LDK93_02750 [Staphylococcus pasteuri]|uniref:phage tail spike protein n=1 Tax=Staphylococcus pasteuri TaxID=45972 RepID=UPI001E41FDBD|nr:phage tail spike protein [Staphylococcus pasteuri]MCD9065978.1 hypothetical protein [Staphylococcus pasteuri]